MKDLIRIGTRDSQLALWQAEKVKSALAENGYQSQLVHINTRGDTDLSSPLHKMGQIGVFTHSLNRSLLNKEIDIAVHSLKDVPTTPEEGIIQGAILMRGPYHDLLVPRTSNTFLQSEGYEAVIATGSIRRKAQWLYKFPHHQIVGLRGNVNTRLKKLEENEWDGAIFAQAGLHRLNLIPENAVVLDWMLSAPGQGAVQVACRSEDPDMMNICRSIHHQKTALCTDVERQFMRTLEGGCAYPIGAHATSQGNEIYFRGRLTSLDGTLSKDIVKKTSLESSKELGKIAAHELLENGGKEILDQIQKDLKQ